MVLKAKVIDGKTYFLCIRKGKLTGNQFIDIFEGKQSLPVGVSEVFYVDKSLDIPKMYLGDVDIKSATPISDSNLVSILQELYPEFFTSDDWVGSYCSKTMLSSSDGSWKEDGEVITYDNTKEVKVLRDDCVRHRKDVEYERLFIDKKSCECSFSSRKYTRHGMESKTYIFDRKYKVWVEQMCNIDSSVIGIKR